tara:strand:+ start:132 stop:1331 length:1200 start_codon:yes stop_codon:yes gene_type:complete
MKNVFYVSLVLIVTSLLSGCYSTSENLSEASFGSRATTSGKETVADSLTTSSTYVFGWGSLPAGLASPRGGTTQGTPVDFAPARKLPLVEIASASSSFEKDRAAILSLAGDYKTSFHFMETLGLYLEHEPTRPYYSWATEEIRILEDRRDFISLQHTLVMHFEMDDGSIMEPMVMKHWRQDWTYEDTDLHTFRGSASWGRELQEPESVSGRWSQAVWQVDDSPRYEAIGRWTHDGNRSIWTGENSWRPLPRREYSVRDDYDVMEGFHRIIIVPTGWIHEQNNWKRIAGDASEATEYRGHELGIDRYERIVSPSLDSSDSYWEKTGPYWHDVREAWKAVYEKWDHFSLKSKVENRSQFEYHFEYAAKLEGGEPYDPAKGAAFARETIESFLTEAKENTRY